MFAAKKFTNTSFVCPYYDTVIHHYLSSHQSTRKVYGDGVLKTDVARFSNYALYLIV